MLSFTKLIDKFFYHNYKDKWDAEIFRKIVMKYICPESVILDIGSGRWTLQQLNFKGLCQRVCGVDPDPQIMENCFLDEAKIGIGEAIPYSDSYFDTVIASNVLEHIQNPMLFFEDVHRVLKKEGIFLIKTPNKYHYISMMALLTPTIIHKYYNKLRGRAEEDTYPTYYKINTKNTLYRIAKEAGFKVERFYLLEGRPEYMRLNIVTYLIGAFYERMVNLISPLSIFRVLIIAVLIKT